MTYTKELLTDKEVQIRVEKAHEAIISVANIRQYRMSRPVASRLGENLFSSLIQYALCGEKHSFQRDSRNGSLRAKFIFQTLATNVTEFKTKTVPTYI